VQFSLVPVFAGSLDAADISLCPVTMIKGGSAGAARAPGQINPRGLVTLSASRQSKKKGGGPL
jgi:hypothetical protein